MEDLKQKAAVDARMMLMTVQCEIHELTTKHDKTHHDFSKLEDLHDSANELQETIREIEA